MASCVLHEASFVAEAVATVLSHAMEVSLVFSVPTVVVSTVLIEPASNKYIY